MPRVTRSKQAVSVLKPATESEKDNVADAVASPKTKRAPAKSDLTFTLSPEAAKTKRVRVAKEKPTKLNPKAKKAKSEPKGKAAKRTAEPDSGEPKLESVMETEQEPDERSDHVQEDEAGLETDKYEADPEQPKPVGKVARAKAEPKGKTTKKATLTKPALEHEAELASESSDEVNQKEVDFAKLEIIDVIDESTQSKFITFKGEYNDQVAVIRLEKVPFDEQITRDVLRGDNSLSKRIFINDIYSSYKISPKTSPLNDLQATVIWPASDTVLAKYTRSDFIFFSESPDVYKKVVEPYIESKLTNEKDYNNWVYNILDGKTEVDRVILDDPDPDSGFKLIPDLKSSSDDKDIHLVAICYRRDIRCLRDLNNQHLILLKNILTKGTKVVKETYKTTSGQIRSYIHYHPSFYHFHVHFRIVVSSECRASDRDNLLSNVINNITIHKDYYKKSTLTYPLPLISPLYLELQKAKRV